MTIQVGVFISHSWAYSDHYEKIASWVFKELWSVNGEVINFADTSVPRDDPIHDAPNDSALMARILERLQASNILVCPTGMYSTHSKWISKELKGAKDLYLPILGVDPWGQERKSSVVRSNANLTVGWNKKSVIDGIWQLKR